MELKEFVKNVLVELNDALNEVKQETGYTYIYGDNDKEHINFEINITVEEGKSLEAGAKLKVLGIGLGSEGSVNDKINNSHKISFSLTEKGIFTGNKNNGGILVPEYKTRIRNN